MREKSCCQEAKCRAYIEVAFMIALLGLLRVGTADMGIWPVPEQQWYSPGMNLLVVAVALFAVAKIRQSTSTKAQSESEEP